MPRIHYSALLLAIALVLPQACSRDPEEVKATAFKKGNAYAAEGKHAEAIVEYRVAIQADPKFGEARFRLAQAYAKIGDRAGAYREYVRAADLLPADLEAQLAAGNILLMAEQYEDAKARAVHVLERDAKNAGALILLGNAMGGLKEFDAAVAKLEEAVQFDPDGLALASLGTVQLARGSRPEAEEAFQKAIKAAPNKVEPHLAFANYLLTLNRHEEAERALRDAVAADPADALANRALAIVLLRARKWAEAEPYMKALADADTSPASAHKLALADYYLGLQRADDAERVLKPLREKETSFVAATARMAVIEYGRKRTEAGNKLVAEALAKAPKDVPTLLTKARFLETQKKYQEALEPAKVAATAEPDNIQVRYTLGNIHRALNHRPEALAEYNEVLRLNPRAWIAHLELSRLKLEERDIAGALASAEAGLQASPGEPNLQLALSRALIAKGDTSRAEVLLKRLLVSLPDSSLVHSTQGMLSASRRDWCTARSALDRALKLDERNAEAFSGLVGVELSDGKPEAARARIDEYLARHPDDASALVVSARAYLIAKDMVKAEEALTRAVDSSTTDLSAYMMLAQLLVSKGEVGQAIERLEGLLTRAPGSAGAHTLVGMLLQSKGQMDRARAHYEKALQVDPRAAVAANNLAAIIVEKGENLDVALQLAQTAKRHLPDRPEVNDTLGWVYHRKGLSNLAVPLLRSAVAANGSNAIYHYHLGMALSGVGNKKPARTALQQALALNANFNGAEEARSVLKSLN